jgi:hypothetical protein
VRPQLKPIDLASQAAKQAHAPRTLEAMCHVLDICGGPFLALIEPMRSNDPSIEPTDKWMHARTPQKQHTQAR